MDTRARIVFDVNTMDSCLQRVERYISISITQKNERPDEDSLIDASIATLSIWLAV